MNNTARAGIKPAPTKQLIMMLKRIYTITNIVNIALLILGISSLVFSNTIGELTHSLVHSIFGEYYFGNVLIICACTTFMAGLFAIIYFVVNRKDDTSIRSMMGWISILQMLIYICLITGTLTFLYMIY